MKRRPLLGLCLALLALVNARGEGPPPPPAYRHFHSAIYIPVHVVATFASPGVLESEWERISSQLHVDHVYIESYRDRVVADGALLERVKAFFASRGVAVSGGMALSDTEGGQFRSFCYTDPADRAYVARVSAFTARHFDDIILDDFFFVNTKFPSDIAAKGARSWTDFRLALMDDVARNVVLAPARAANPRVRIVIKFPNWYEHFQGNGFDLKREPEIFPGIYTGTETREAAITDQNLQAYESYAIVRFFDAIAPGRNGGGWVDTYDVTYVDRYAEQLWDTLLAKAREITLFEWADLLSPIVPGPRPWANQRTTFELGRIDLTRATMARAAGLALEEADRAVGQLGRPLGVPCYKPLNSVGEDFLPNYLGMMGIPIALRPDFPADAPVTLLTASAAADPDIVGEIKQRLMAGRDIVITSGLLRALHGRGIEDIAEIRDTGQPVAMDRFFGAYGPGAGADLGRLDGNRPALIPQLRFITNDAWPIVRTVSGEEGFPMLLMDRYGRGSLFVLTVPDNFSDLYRLPRGVLNMFRRFIAGRLPVQLEGPAKLALFVYDNDTFVVESYLNDTVTAGVSVAGDGASLAEAEGAPIPALPVGAPQGRRWAPPEHRTHFQFTIPPHSFRVFRLGSSS